MGVPNTLFDIREKVRRLAGVPSPDDISDVQIDQYINTYYLYDMPESLRLLKLKDTFTFITEPNVEVYPFDNEQYITVEPPCYVRGIQAQYFQDLDLFYREWPKDNNIQIVGTGNGTSGPYIGQVTGTPFLRSVNINPLSVVGRDVRVLFSANIGGSSATSAIDDGAGGWVNEAPGTPNDGLVLPGSIDYLTGIFTITFDGIVPVGENINASFIPYAASAPRTICMYQNQFFVRPIPDKAYIVEINAFRYPTSLTQDLNTPELDFWWQLLAFGAARKILIDNADFESVAAMEPYFLEQLAYVQRRTIKQQTNQRSSTIYNNSGSNYGYGNLYPYI